MNLIYSNISMNLMNPMNPVNPIIICPKCRSADIIKYSDTGFICRTCANELSLYNGKDISDMYNKIIESTKKPDMDFISGYRVMEKFTAEEFKKVTFQFLRNSERVPSYVFNEFQCDNIMLYEVPILKVEGKVDVNYTRTLGFDRDEISYKFSTRTYSNGIEVKDPYRVHRTVTDWHQDNGCLRGESKGTEINMDNNDYDGLLNEVDSIDYSSMVPLTNIELNYYKVNKNKLEIIKKRMVDEIYRKELPKSGDHSKDESYNGTAEITNSILILPKIYYIAIYLRNMKAIFYSMASGNLNVYMTGEFPKENDEEEFQKQIKEIKHEKHKLKLIFNILSYFSIISEFIIFVLFILKGKESSELLKLTFISLWVCILLFIIFKSIGKYISYKYKKRINKIIDEKKKKVFNIKKEALNKIYPQYN